MITEKKTKFLEDELEQLRQQHLFRPLRVLGAPQDTEWAIDAEGITVACGYAGAVRCARGRDGGTKAAAAALAQTIGLEPGARLGG